MSFYYSYFTHKETEAKTRLVTVELGLGESGSGLHVPNQHAIEG